eukprot:187339_1
MLRMNPFTSGMWSSIIPFVVTKRRSPSRLSLFRGVQGTCDEDFDDVCVTPEDLAFIQYSSGSTQECKGVMITFGSLQAAVKILESYSDQHCSSGKRVGFSWLPYFHDMGLAYYLLPFASECLRRMHFTSPLTFIHNPVLWLELMARHGCEVSSAPDFAFCLVVRKWMGAKHKRNVLSTLNLSCIRPLMNASEPVHWDTRELFITTFSPYGLNEKCMIPAYGLAENVVMVCHINEFVCSSSSSPHPGVVAVAKRSTLHASLDLRIVHPDSLEELPENSVGELWVAGPSVAAGYFGRPSLTEDVFLARIKGAETSRSFLRTGDLAFFEGKEGFLFICGRIKDLIIINGANVYPQDVEKAVQDSTPAVKPGRVAAFSEDDQSKSGNLIVVFELRKGNDPGMACEVTQKAVCTSVGVRPSRLVAISEGEICKALNGKIQRRATRDALLGGKLNIVYEQVCALADFKPIEESSTVELGVEREGTELLLTNGVRNSERV